jgi:hypothetical protein
VLSLLNRIVAKNKFVKILDSHCYCISLISNGKSTVSPFVVQCDVSIEFTNNCINIFFDVEIIGSFMSVEYKITKLTICKA